MNTFYFLICFINLDLYFSYDYFYLDLKSGKYIDNYDINYDNQILITQYSKNLTKNVISFIQNTKKNEVFQFNPGINEMLLERISFETSGKDYFIKSYYINNTIFPRNFDNLYPYYNIKEEQSQQAQYESLSSREKENYNSPIVCYYSVSEPSFFFKILIYPSQILSIHLVIILV